MNRQASSATRRPGIGRLACCLVATAFIAVACGRNASGHDQPNSATAPAGNPAATTLTSTAPDASLTAVTTQPTGSAAPGTTSASPAAPVYSAPPVASDPVTADLTVIDQSIQSISNSISGADSGTSGGE